MNIEIRKWKDGEQAFLEDFLYEAIFIPERITFCCGETYPVVKLCE